MIYQAIDYNTLSVYYIHCVTGIISPQSIEVYDSNDQQLNVAVTLKFDQTDHKAELRFPNGAVIQTTIIKAQT